MKARDQVYLYLSRIQLQQKHLRIHEVMARSINK